MWLFVLRRKVEKCILMTSIGAGFRILGILRTKLWNGAAVTLPAGSSNILCVFCESEKVTSDTVNPC